jgi:hypothetical protein
VRFGEELLALLFGHLTGHAYSSGLDEVQMHLFSR